MTDTYELSQVDPIAYAESGANDKLLAYAFHNIKSGIVIDIHNLSTGISRQPELFLEAKEFAIHLTSLRDRAKREFEEATGAANIAARAALEKEGAKITEALVMARALVDPAVIASKDRILILSRLSANANAMAEAYTQRGFMLKELASLHGTQYYGESDALQAHREARSTHTTQGGDTQPYEEPARGTTVAGRAAFLDTPSGPA